jgi:hypothetical protein
MGGGLRAIMGQGAKPKMGGRPEPKMVGRSRRGGFSVPAPPGGTVSMREPQITLKTASEAFTSSHGATKNFTGESNDWQERRGFPRVISSGSWSEQTLDGDRGPRCAGIASVRVSPTMLPRAAPFGRET